MVYKQEDWIVRKVNVFSNNQTTFLFISFESCQQEIVDNFF